MTWPRKNKTISCYLFYFLFFFNTLSIMHAQSTIKAYGIKINLIDKKQQKQGDWIFFDSDGNISVSCSYKNDRVEGPVIYYKNTDTAFIRLKVDARKEVFSFYNQRQVYNGEIVYPTDSTHAIIMHTVEYDGYILDSIKAMVDFSLSPVYNFAQRKLIDHISAGFNSSNYVFNKPIYVVLSINSSGKITDVVFPKEMNNLSSSEEKELHWIYSTMPRWQPYFFRNETRAIKIGLVNNHSLSIITSER
jgi:hypothetical protein